MCEFWTWWSKFALSQLYSKVSFVLICCVQQFADGQSQGTSRAYSNGAEWCQEGLSWGTWSVNVCDQMSLFQFRLSPFFAYREKLSSNAHFNRSRGWLLGSFPGDLQRKSVGSGRKFARPHTEQITYPVPEPVLVLDCREMSRVWCFCRQVVVMMSCGFPTEAGLPAAGWHFVNQHGFRYQAGTQSGAEWHKAGDIVELSFEADEGGIVPRYWWYYIARTVAQVEYDRAITSITDCDCGR